MIEQHPWLARMTSPTEGGDEDDEMSVDEHIDWIRLQQLAEDEGRHPTEVEA